MLDNCAAPAVGIRAFDRDGIRLTDPVVDVTDSVKLIATAVSYYYI
ncbi:hypothetical protein F441_13713 [Phytophthora nicotianae CJ01A1]|uniref:Uncharacterized protein n=4 Tax=Phytophthora nicotianae TaxID=4792 RepID=V9EQ03_PHYNI|nr:hypothetical protein F443_13788 [Phytophthora nicotianae P1569]ETM40976.1 hypothetical protein L914_13236 [Phytophthora nicotianae]ETO69619.1 hypothetical protein F444_13842 [Phytophthora nicotianae P1976]ETP10740.1 hypothetical protein F441_13713 [Phytophthora nicotianae CJ01A1]